MSRRIFVVIVAIITLSLFTPLAYTPRVEAQELGYCSILYFFNGIVIIDSTINATLILETPVNLTLPGGFTQRVKPLLVYNLEFDETRGLYYFNISEHEEFTGFFIVEVEVCTRDPSEMYNLLVTALKNPQYTIVEQEYPSDVLKEYIREPHQSVVEKIVPAYESWLREKYGVASTNISRLGLMATMGYFVYRVYFTYDPSVIPRSFDDIVESRRGDCDDLSRVLVDLLHYYNIPAIMASGYLYLSDLNLTIPVENTTYIFLGNGPHAFTLAYLPGYGWISLDFLAGSVIVYPFVFEGYTVETEISESEVSEFIDLHKRINATQVFLVFSQSEIEKVFSGGFSIENSLKLLEKYTRVPLVETTTTPTTTATTTPITTTTPTTSTTSATSITTSSATGITGTESPSESTMYIMTVALITILLALLVFTVYILLRKII